MGDYKPNIKCFRVNKICKLSGIIFDLKINFLVFYIMTHNNEQYENFLIVDIKSQYLMFQVRFNFRLPNFISKKLFLTISQK